MEVQWDRSSKSALLSVMVSKSGVGSVVNKGMDLGRVSASFMNKGGSVE